MAYVKIITKAPEDVYGDDAWFMLFNQNPTECWRINPDRLEHHNDAVFIHWSLLTDSEREAIRWEWLLEEPEK